MPTARRTRARCRRHERATERPKARSASLLARLGQLVEQAHQHVGAQQDIAARGVEDGAALRCRSGGARAEGWVIADGSRRVSTKARSRRGGTSARSFTDACSLAVERAKPRARWPAALHWRRSTPAVPTALRCVGARRATAELALARAAPCCASCLCSVLRQAALDASPCGDAQPPSPCAPRRRRGARRLIQPTALRGTSGGPSREHSAGSRRGAGGRQAQRLCGAEQRRPVVGACAARASSSDSSRLFERSERSERSEFRDATAGRAAQGSRRSAATAAAKRSLPPTCTSARARHLWHATTSEASLYRTTDARMRARPQALRHHAVLRLR